MQTFAEDTASSVRLMLSTIVNEFDTGFEWIWTTFEQVLHGFLNNFEEVLLGKQ